MCSHTSEKIRVYLISANPVMQGSASDICSYLCSMLGLDEALRERFVYDAQKPQYIVAENCIYNSSKHYNEFLRFLNNQKVVLIFRANELFAFDRNIFDYYIGYERSSDYDRFVSSFSFSHPLYARLKNRNRLTKHEAAKLLPTKKFCNFIYGNRNVPAIRDNLFYKLSEYKRVDSLGAHLNNCSNENTRDRANWEVLSIEMKSGYKFSIACENAVADGYTTEKLLTSFEAHTVPIYWGNPSVEEHFNPKAFVNCHNYSSLDEVLERVKEIDSNPDLWCEMVSQSWQTAEQYKQTEVETQKYQKFLTKIFTLPIEKAIRRPFGTSPEQYRDWWARGFGISRLLREIYIQNRNGFLTMLLGKNKFAKLRKLKHKLLCRRSFNARSLTL